MMLRLTCPLSQGMGQLRTKRGHGTDVVMLLASRKHRHDTAYPSRPSIAQHQRAALLDVLRVMREPEANDAVIARAETLRYDAPAHSPRQLPRDAIAEPIAGRGCRC